MRKRLIAGNWKLNGSWTLCEQMLQTLSAAQGFVAQTPTELVICPPAVYLARFNDLINKQAAPFKLGGQDVSMDANGAHTGELAATMLAECGASYGIVGHSEHFHAIGLIRRSPLVAPPLIGPPISLDRQGFVFP